MSTARRTQRIAIRRVQGSQARPKSDLLAVEEPLEMRLEYERDGSWHELNVALTMRTPGDDFELAAGFLRSEGIIQSKDDIKRFDYCLGGQREEQHHNILRITLRQGVHFAPDRLLRHFTMNASCGVCGKASLDALSEQGCLPLADDGTQLAAALLHQLPTRLQDAQTLFSKTGGLHAAGLFDTTGALLGLYEDIGRHNAVDKVIGAQLLADRWPLTQTILLLSGRASFEIMQKALHAKIPVIAAISAPSSLAVSLAQTFQISLVGFLREGHFNLYHDTGRILLNTP